jgi:hypothetical protein
MSGARNYRLAPRGAARQPIPDVAAATATAPRCHLWRLWHRLLALRASAQRSKAPERIYLAPF